MEYLKTKYPNTTFIHFTVPLSELKTTYRTWMKKILGRKDIWEYDDIIVKNEFNELLRKEYSGKEPILDIATIESTCPDGSRKIFKRNGKKYYYLAPEYTDDGGHLNMTGRKKVAEQLLLFLVNLK